jgi:DNA-directed RNA polymerase specialized sigma24 family protein
MHIEAKLVQASMPSTNEISLVQAFTRARDGDKDGFEQLYLHYQPIYKIRLFRLVEEWEIAEELYQEAIMRAWQGLSKKQSFSHFERSLYVVVRKFVRRTVSFRS